MQDIAKMLTIRPGTSGAVEIDGTEFPYAIADIPIRIDADSRGLHVAFIPVLVERVEVQAVPES